MSSKYPRKLRCVYVGLVAIKFLIMYDVASTAVAATSFFTGEKKIFDFVFERVKRCIAANVENEWSKFLKTRIAKIGLGVLLLYFISSALLVILQIV